ncbi:Hypothetical protein NTJ_15990 [Nesidiocoris tenuis]|uniref:Uncharacterized protein n=1 Tax=Nesidiocoris tenuis TaxID=355587 RepID=A0ABN7BI93_9HEMI|nr:Hypothetical protein NTJ_15990 [Nesidiocoris tenuis]
MKAVQSTLCHRPEYQLAIFPTLKVCLDTALKSKWIWAMCIFRLPFCLKRRRQTLHSNCGSTPQMYFLWAFSELIVWYVLWHLSQVRPLSEKSAGKICNEPLAWATVEFDDSLDSRSFTVL